MCKHLNCEVQEEFIIHDVIFVKDGLVSTQGHDLEYPMPTGKYFVKCYDCGMKRSYKARKPKWLEGILDKALLALKEA